MNTTFFPKQAEPGSAAPSDKVRLESLTKKVPSKIAQKKGTTVIMLIIFVLISLVISAVIGAAIFYGAGARAEKAGEEPFSTLAKVQEKLAGNFPDLEMDPGTFQATCINQDALFIKVAVVNLCKKVAESPETDGFYVCEINEDGDPILIEPGYASMFRVDRNQQPIPKLESAGKQVVTLRRNLGAPIRGVCPVTFAITINADCEDWVDESNEDNNEIVRICSRNEIGPAGGENAPCSNPPYCTYTCSAP